MQHALDYLYADGEIRTGTLVAINAEKMLAVEDNPEVRALIEAAEFKYADGISVVRSLRKKYPQAQVSRVAGADLWEALMARAGAQGTPVFLIGGKPEVLAQYGLIGSIYAEAVLGIGKPRVAVLNIGEEETKGNAQTKATYELLKEDGRINFVGNVEGSYIFTGQVADVIVCDGFVGNTVLKMAEGLYRINKKLGGGNAFWDAMNYENVGGTPVLGVNAPVVIGHGISSPKAIRSMILSAERCITADLTAKLQRAFKN